MEHYKAQILVTQKIIVTNDDGKILTMRRSQTDPSLPLSWDIPGGVVEVGEHLIESISREVTEETRIEVEDIKLFDVFDSSSKIHPYLICIGYTAHALSTNVVLSYEHDQFEWLTKDEFLSRDVKAHIKELVRRLN
jgi:8-oxo-dGTP diphosphatase